MMSTEELQFCAKYPFTKQAKDYIKEESIDFSNIEMDFLDYAVKRVQESLDDKVVRPVVSSAPEILSLDVITFPLAKILASLTKDRYIVTALARGESRRALSFLKFEDNERIYNIGSQFFDLKKEGEDIIIPFTQYLNAVPEGQQFKLVNQKFHSGFVYIDYFTLSNLIAQHVFNSILKTKVDESTVPKEFIYFADQLKKDRKHFHITDLGDVDADCFPPCMRKILQDLKADEVVAHQPRFVLATFLMNIGMSIDEAIKLFQNQPNFDEEKTRYYLEHAAGKQSGTKYSVPSCSTMETYGVCFRDYTCKWKSPLWYYINKKKQKRWSKKK